MGGKLVGVMALALGLAGCAKPPPSTASPLALPTNYDDCVLQHLKPAQNELATESILEACRSKFPEKPKPPSPSDRFQAAGGVLAEGENIFADLMFDAGYKWAQENNIRSADRCANESASHRQGCAAFVAEQLLRNQRAR